MTSTRETRIYAHYRAIRLRLRTQQTGWSGTGSSLWMPLARHWKMPIAEVKRIVAEQKALRP